MSHKSEDMKLEGICDENTFHNLRTREKIYWVNFESMLKKYTSKNFDLSQINIKEEIEDFYQNIIAMICEYIHEPDGRNFETAVFEIINTTYNKQIKELDEKSRNFEQCSDQRYLEKRNNQEPLDQEIELKPRYELKNNIPHLRKIIVPKLLSDKSEYTEGFTNVSLN